MIRYLVKRPKDTVEVLLLPNKDGSGYQYINLTNFIAWFLVLPGTIVEHIKQIREYNLKLEDK